MNYKINPFVKVFQRGSAVALFNGLTLQTAYLSQTEFENIESCENFDELFTNQFLVPDDFDSNTYFEQFKSNQKINTEIKIAYFLLTDACNFRCKYCFIKTRMKEENGLKMGFETVRKAVNLVARNTQNVKIIFYGGEPILNKDVLKFIVDYAREKIKNVQFSMVTNGALIDDAMAKFIQENKISIGISLDGPARINDKMRVTTGQKGTYRQIQHGITKLKESTIPFGLSVTLGPHNLNESDALVNEILKVSPSGIGQNLLTLNNGVSAESRAIISTALANEEKLRANGIIDDRIFSRKIKPFLEEKPRFKDCGAYGNQLVVTPNGQLGICHGLWPDNENKDQVSSYFPITVDYEGLLVEHPYWKEWAGRIPLNMPKCRTCFGISLCGGGCAKNSIVTKGSIWETDDAICDFTKQTIEKMVWDYYDGKYDDLNSSELLKQVKETT